MAYTGGPLNDLNGKYGISDKDRSVPVIRLIRIHQPKSKDELCELIKYHYENDCDCKIKSKGTIEDFGKRLYEGQIKEWGEYRYSLKDCNQWEYDLFVSNSLKGNLMENKALAELKKLLPEHEIKEADGFVDEDLRIDLIVLKSSTEISGIQVKPESYKKMREGVIIFNKIANAKLGQACFLFIL